MPRDLLSRLRPAPTGYRYVRVGTDILLLSLATSLVVAIAGPVPVAEALRRLREHTDRPIAAVMYTHFHYVDGTVAVLEEGNHADPLPVIGHERIAANKVSD